MKVIVKAHSDIFKERREVKEKKAVTANVNQLVVPTKLKVTFKTLGNSLGVP